MPGLQEVGGGEARCKHCGAQAVGPCARCHDPVCGDCCVLTERGAQPWAICLACNRRAGRSLGGGWWTVAMWVGGPIALLLAAVILLELLTR